MSTKDDYKYHSRFIRTGLRKIKKYLFDFKFNDKKVQKTNFLYYYQNNIKFQNIYFKVSLQTEAKSSINK